MQPGDLSTLTRFQSPVQQRDEDGQLHQGWQTEFEAWAHVRHLRGGESVMQARMASRSPAILTIRNSAAARSVTSEWRAVVRDRTGIERVYEMREDPRPSEGSGFLEMLAESGA